MVQIGEMEAIYSGISFGKTLKKEIVYTLDQEMNRVYDNKVRKGLIQVLEYPFLAVNIGSGVSIIKFSAPNGEFKRVGGTSLGGKIIINRF